MQRWLPEPRRNPASREVTWSRPDFVESRFHFGQTSHHVDRVTSYGREAAMCFLVPHMFDITKRGGNSTRINRPNPAMLRRLTSVRYTEDISVRDCHADAVRTLRAILRAPGRSAFRRKLAR